METTGTIIHAPFTEFIASFKQKLRGIFHVQDEIDRLTRERGFPEGGLSEVMAANPFAVAIPARYGGRGSVAGEALGLLDAASYESLPLSLFLGINTALFLGPVAKYGQEPVKGKIFNRFLNNQNMGGLMITEPDYGSDALNMHTTNVKTASGYHIKGIKHWQGLTGMADYWLLTSRRKLDNGELARDIDFFISDEQMPGQQIRVREYYNNSGLYPIPYGMNIIDVNVPEENKLQPESTGLKLMMDLLHRSRLQFPGMAAGFLRRMLDDAVTHTNTRVVKRKPLIELDQVKQQVSEMQSAFTVSSAMCVRSAAISGIDNDLAGSAVEANTMKAYVTDLMQDSAQTLAQLLGANGYKSESIASRGIIDSRPFRIFEGSNEMLYTQITEMVLKMMGNIKRPNLSDFLKQYHLTDSVAGYFKSLTDFIPDIKMPQRKQVSLGKILSRIIAANHVIKLGERGFRNDLITGSLETIRHEVTTLVSSFSFKGKVVPVEGYNDGGSWLEYC
jgi:alkylation response protein AidB-like acyl-CoA dehydrogenase